MYISDQFIQAIIEKKSPIVVGLDPRFEQIPEEIRKKNIEQYGETLEAVSKSFIEFNRGIIDAVCDEVPAVKPQIAFYEQYGIEGLVAYKDACDYAASKGLIVIADVKRGDIGSTSKAYSIAHLGKVKVGETLHQAFEADYATVNPYLGDDCMSEFMDEIEKNHKGIFILVKTSNPTSGQIQDLKIGEDTIADRVADMVSQWNEKYCGDSGYSPIGAVVGATYPEELARLRKRMPKTILLVPGYGAQGGGAEDIIGAFNEDGLGAIINNSRGIIFAYEKKGIPYQEAAKEAVLEMKHAIQSALEKSGKKFW